MTPGRRASLAFGPALAVVVSVLAPTSASASVSAAATVAAESMGQLKQLLQLLGAQGAKQAPPAVAGPAQEPNAKDQGPNVFPQPDREILRRMDHARQLIEKERYGEAVRFLGEILEGPEDFFFRPSLASSIHISLKAEAQRLIGRMPPAGRELYELQFGARAKQMLSEAISQGDAQRLAEVSRRFFHTQAGYEATFLLGVHHQDAGQPLAAALTFQRLRDESGAAGRFEPTLSLALATCWVQAGSSDKAQKVMDELCRHRAGQSVWIAGQEVRLPGASAGALKWLESKTGVAAKMVAAHPVDWIMPGGNPSRTAVVEATRPLLNLVWQSPVSEHPLATVILRQRTRLDAERNSLLMPEIRPLAVGNTVLTRSLRGLVAIDFTTGKRLWESPADDLLDGSNTALRTVQSQPGQLESAVCQRVWNDRIFGALSSDGQLVFAVEDLGLSTSSRYASRRIIMLQGGAGDEADASSPCNRLAAYSIRTGKLAWELGGDRADGLSESGTFFLGPPLPLADRLYQLAEVNGEIRLLALEASTGRRLWAQQIAMAERNIAQDGLRRQFALTPSYADGVLVCPTANGALVAVELAGRSLLWGYRYALDDDSDRRRGMGWRMGSYSVNQMGTWASDEVLVSDGRVLAASGDSQFLHCLGLADGQPLWKTPSQGDLFIACVRDGVVVLVGQRQIRAIHLSDGRPAWDGRTLAVPGESLPSGRGFAADNLYYLPLNSAEIVSIDVKNGKIVHTARSREGIVPGNLVSHQGKILSQTSTGLETFHQIDALKSHVDSSLAKKPDDAEALTLRAELLLDDGKRDEALDCLRRAYAADARIKTREMLRETLLTGLADDFAVYRDKIEEIKPLLEGPDDQMTFLRLMADGFESQEDWKSALDHYFQLAKVEVPRTALMKVGPALSVRPDRWIQSRLGALREAAPPEVVEELDRVVRERLAEAVHDDKPEGLERFLALFGLHPLASQARSALAERYEKGGRLLAAERLLRWDEGTCDQRTSPAALVQLAGFYRRVNRPDDAAACYRELTGRYADTACDHGKTGRQLVEALAADDPVRAKLAGDDWPTGHVEATTTTSTNRSYRYGSGPLTMRGEPGPFLAPCGFEYDSNQKQVKATDAWGRKLWETAVEPRPNNQEGYIYYGYERSNAAHALASGRLLLASTGAQYHALDTTVAGDKPRVLWSQDFRNVLEPDPDGPVIAPSTMSRLVQQWGMSAESNALQSRGPFESRFEGVPSVLSPRSFAVAYFRRCMAVDPLTGETLWVRRGIPRGAILLGDAEHLFLLPAERGAGGRHEAIVLNALNGEEMAARRSVPGVETWAAHAGGKVLTWRLEAGKYRLELFDIWQQRVVWGPHDFDSRSKVVAVQDAAGVFEPNGRFTLFRMDDGKKLFDGKLRAESNPQEVLLTTSGDQYLLIVQGPYRGKQNTYLGGLQGVRAHPIRQGRMFAFDRGGKRLWKDYPEGVEITNQQLIVNQPAGLPVIAFGSQVYEPQGNGSDRWKTAILMLDRRTGRRVIDQQLTNQAHFFNLSGDPTAKTIRVDLYRSVMELKFTNKPIPPTPPGKKPGESTDPSKPAGGLLDAIRKAMG